jgi:hypothetical protein
VRLSNCARDPQDPLHVTLTDVGITVARVGDGWEFIKAGEAA